MRYLVCLLLASSTVVAQEVDPESFFPYASGNTWEFVVTTWGEGQFEQDTTVSYTTLTIVRDTVIAEHPGSVYTVARLDSLQRLQSRSICSGYFDADRWITSSPGGCLIAPTQYSSNHIGYVTSGGIVEVEGQSYPVAAVAEGATGFGCGSGGTTCHYEWIRASQVGLIRWRSEQTRMLSPTYSRVTEGRLAYAQVGSETFGASVFPTNALLGPPAATWSVTTAPNPAHGRLRVFIDGAPWGRVTLRLYDVTGRRVWSARLRDDRVVDLSALPPGVYVLLTVDEAGSRSTTRITHMR